MRDTIANWHNITLITLLFTQVFLAPGLNTGNALLQAATVSDRATKQGASTYYVSDAAERFSSDLTQLRSRDLLTPAAQSRARWRQAMMKASEEDKALLQESFAMQEHVRIDREKAEGQAASFVATLREVMGNHGAKSCRELTCGDLGYCDPGLGPEVTCRCQAGYEGNGLVCNPPADFVEHALIAATPGAAPPQVADLHVSTLSGSRVAVTFRDISRQNQGFMVIGEAHNGGMRWGAATLISGESQVFSPVTSEMPGSGILALAYRRQDLAGDGVLRCVRRESDGSVTFGKPYMFANLQAQAMSLVGMPQSRVAVLFAEHLAQGKTGERHFEMHGSSLLAQMSPTDLEAPQLLGKYHFADGPVSRISVAPLSPMLFAVAFREGQDEAAPTMSREASVALAELWGSRLVFTTKAIPLEPSQDKIWARSVAGLGNNAFAYTYHSGAEQVTKQAVLRLEPDSHRLVMLQEPQTIATGFTPFVSTVSTVQQEDLQMASQLELLQSHGHRLFTFLGSAEGARGEGTICAVAQGLPVGCKNTGRTSREVVSVASAPVGDGRIFLLSADAKGSPPIALLACLVDGEMDTLSFTLLRQSS
eukprot:CAMPEP_0197630092 /NCGR_PEP_ID=MMETSP1338-20131121/7689_1 /TAXON_ID=43686 ORGANISM="Pelagodinium beii, Strain RCC1491" /NCGR_SAMPLE_ID=MMETSP1338 /ASSEMBLY_ACC=CAM_ASM_000754 /LENGTH=592 /DNA_ID=CAMNT_0043201239 /DNA_START=51 /DNA_END=1826 /DNA_ORIENTATION=-